MNKVLFFIIVMSMILNLFGVAEAKPNRIAGEDEEWHLEVVDNTIMSIENPYI